MGLLAAEEEGPPVHASPTAAVESEGADQKVQLGREGSVSSGDDAPPASSADALARHLNGLKLDLDAGSSSVGSPQNGLGHAQPLLSSGYGGQFANGGGQFMNGGGHFQGGQLSPDGFPGPMHMVPMPLIIPPSPADTLHLPMTLSSPLEPNLDPNAREFTPSPSPSPSGVVGLPVPPPFSMGPGFDPSFMFGQMHDMGHPMYAQNGEFTGQFFNPSQYSPGSGSPSPTSWENRFGPEGDPHLSRGFGPLHGSPPGREHVSRALLISGVDPSTDDGLLREELSQWGPVRALGLERKPEGLVTVNYFDLRHAKEALHEIQQHHLKHQREMQDMLQQGPSAEKGRRPRSQKGRSSSDGGEDMGERGRGMISGRAVWAQYTLPAGAAAGPDAHNQGTLVVFNLDSDMPVEELRKAFEKYGDVKELRETPSKRQHKFVEFFDVRAAGLALQSLDGAELGGKHIKIEFSRPGGQARRAQAGRGQLGGPASLKPLNGATPPGGPMFGVVGWEGNAPMNLPGGFAPMNGGGGMVPPLFMYMPAFPGGGMDPGAPVPGVQFPGGPFPMPPFPHMVPPFGYADPMGGFPGFMRGPLGPGAPDMHGFRGRPGDPKRKGKGPNERREEEFVHGGEFSAGPLRRPKDGSREAPRAQYTFSEFEAELQRENPRTTLMIKNIPNKYSQAMLLALLDAHCVRCNSKLPPGSDEAPSAYDFVYLPIDFKNRCNLGYAFVNFTTAQATLNLYKEFHAQQWEAFNSRKVCQVTYARVQGRKALEDHFRNSRFACDTDEYLPLVFNPPRDGSVLSPPIVAAGHLAGKIASCAGAVSAVAQAHGMEGGGLKGPRIGLVQH